MAMPAMDLGYNTGILHVFTRAIGTYPAAHPTTSYIVRCVKTSLLAPWFLNLFLPVSHGSAYETNAVCVAGICSITNFVQGLNLGLLYLEHDWERHPKFLQRIGACATSPVQ